MKYYPFENLSGMESMVMSLILHYQEILPHRPIDFTNSFAAEYLKTSTRTITDAVSKLKKDDYISTSQTKGRNRIITIIKTPKMICLTQDT